MEVAVRDRPGVPGLADPVVGNLIALGVKMTIETVIRQVELTVGEPLVERRVRVIERDRRLFEPGDAFERLFVPPGLVVGFGLVVDLRSRIRLCDKLGRRFKVRFSLRRFSIAWLSDM